MQRCQIDDALWFSWYIEYNFWFVLIFQVHTKIYGMETLAVIFYKKWYLESLPSFEEVK